MSNTQLTPDKYLTPQELAALQKRLDAVPLADDTGAPLPLNIRDHAYLSFLMLTGVRASEGLNIERRDFLGTFTDDKGVSMGRVHIRTLKQGLDRVVVIPLWLYERCLSITGAEPGDMPFTFLLRRADQIWRLYRPCRKSLHSLRHTFARDLYRHTKDVMLVKYALGHASVSNTQIYVVVDMEDCLGRAMSSTMRGA